MAQEQVGIDYMAVIQRMGMELGQAAARIYLLDEENAKLKVALQAVNGHVPPDGQG